ncbi:MAG: AmmeMemoRadiSam system protein B [Caldimicrobium sp.]
MKRKPAVAGYFYPGDTFTLKSFLEELVEESEEKKAALGIVAPHAGYMYSGKVAGKVYGIIEPPDVAIILGTNHTGLGEKASLFDGESFLTPLGEAKVNQNLKDLILEKCYLVKEDSYAHIREHSIEVQVPFLQYINPQIEIVPLALMDLDLEEIYVLGRSLAEALEEFLSSEERKVLIIASSDFSHYEPHSIAQRKDALAIEEILKLSEEGLLRVVYENRISMCGVLPVCTMLVAVKELGASRAELVDYKTSGDITGDYSAVVGYAGIIIY